MRPSLTTAIARPGTFQSATALAVYASRSRNGSAVWRVCAPAGVNGRRAANPRRAIRRIDMAGRSGESGAGRGILAGGWSHRERPAGHDVLDADGTAT